MREDLSPCVLRGAFSCEGALQDDGSSSKAGQSSVLRRLRSGRFERRTIASLACNLALVLSMALALAGCGKKGAPIAPPGEPDTFPRVYPSE